MKHDLPSLDALKVFESAARLLSFSQAASELCITKAAVSYQIRKLEQELDCSLFRRSIRQVYLTDAGQELMQTTQRLFMDLARTVEQIRSGERQHDVLVGVTTYVALRWLSPRMARFNDLYPDISILLQHSVNSADFRLQDVDFAIRWDRMSGDITRTRLLEMPMPLFPVCSPALLEKTGQRKQNGDWFEAIKMTEPPFATIPLLCEDRALDLWQAWFAVGNKRLANPRRVISDANVRTQAAIDGQGWTLADHLMQRELDSGLLVAPFNHRLDGYGYVIQCAPGRYLSNNARLLRDWLIEQ